MPEGEEKYTRSDLDLLGRGKISSTKLPDVFKKAIVSVINSGIEPKRGDALDSLTSSQKFQNIDLGFSLNDLD